VSGASGPEAWDSCLQGAGWERWTEFDRLRKWKGKAQDRPEGVSEVIVGICLCLCPPLLEHRVKIGTTDAKMGQSQFASL
jgi:hypothetical protein